MNALIRTLGGNWCRRAMLAACLLVLACARRSIEGTGPEVSWRGGYVGVVGCTHEAIQAIGERHRRARLSSPDTLRTPQLGWTACELLALLGPPRAFRLSGYTVEGEQTITLEYAHPLSWTQVVGSVALNPSGRMFLVEYAGQGRYVLTAVR
jgi:hypothetical protein